jgi:hypothetical protein
MDDFQQDLAREEFVALRATIRERGTLRVALFVAVLAAWGGLLVASLAAIGLPVASLVPLLMLAGGFEAIASLHIGVERVGRYVQVRFEQDLEEGPPSTPEGASWERTAMAWGRRFPASGIDPLFATVFLGAVVLNFASVAVMSVAVELVVLALFHVLVIVRIVRVRAWAGRQRKEDLERFRTLGEPERAGGTARENPLAEPPGRTG